MKEKFEIKELINVGVFTALYFVVVFVTCFIGMVPICMVLIPLVIPIVSGIPLMLFFSKIRRFGMFTISGVLFGLIMFLMGSYSWVILLTCGLAGLLADIVLMLGGYKSIFYHNWLKFAILNYVDKCITIQNMVYKQTGVSG